ncbi:hypothetical protein OH76DRAFT_869364 [Lentinus brumalis]|uniref:Secreted protein n=1 Tax=Lentinus brumalis TaxID=2498619 RepID=A0A371DRI3_9APHY|nr:hypothetical protein OH76DRAFT_869364 [Polyporus brumalis]
MMTTASMLALACSVKLRTWGSPVPSKCGLGRDREPGCSSKVQVVHQLAMGEEGFNNTNCTRPEAIVRFMCIPQGDSYTLI